MKYINKLLFTVLYFAISNAGITQDVGIFITTPNGGNLGVGQSDFLDVQLSNNSSSVAVPINKLRPNITVPSVIVINTLGHVLPPGWSIISVTPSAIRICNGTDGFGPQINRIARISITGASVGDGTSQTVTATLQFSNGANCTTPGVATPGDLAGNNTATSTVLLPIILGKFTAAITDCNAKLAWHTLQEVNALKFVVEKSTDAANWQAVAEVRAAGSSASRRNYTATDNMLEGNKPTQYRLKMVDVDGKIAYSPIASVVSNCIIKKVTVYPNPVQNNTFNVFVTGFSEKTTATLRAADGRLVLNKPVREGNNAFNVTNLARGTYFLSVEDTNGNKVKQKVSVIK